MPVKLSRHWNSFQELINLKEKLRGPNKHYPWQGFARENVDWNNGQGFKIGLPAVQDEILDDPFVGILLKRLKEKE